ncbi:hypothetical protein JL721_9414 [Aureococcus anophagefferens]|nr:hypothetical protein JL721_9414 [Aureococcus anophagefferens]
MAEKAHGTTAAPVQAPLRWGVDGAVADRICSFNRHGAERKGCWAETAFLAAGARDETFYDSVTGKPLFVAPRGRSWDAFVRESADHGWPSFRDDEGRSTARLGHNLPDASGNRCCVNLASVAGRPA